MEVITYQGSSRLNLSAGSVLTLETNKDVEHIGTRGLILKVLNPELGT